MVLSIVTTMYKSSEYIDPFYERICKVASTITDDFEVIFVDDGSPDDSLRKAIALHKKYSNVKVIELSRNFGHHKALMTGLAHAKGEYVFLIDSDLEEEPELLLSFWNEISTDEEIDMVYGVQEDRKGKFFERISGDLFYNTFNFFSDVKIPKNFLTVRLMRQDFVSNLVKFQEKEIVFSILNVLNGFRVKPFVVKKLSHSPTTYSFSRKMRLLQDTITASNTKPLLLAFNTGLIITLCSLLYIIYLVIQKLFFNIGVDGWTSLMVFIAFFGGTIILFLGIIGAYLAKIFIEVKNRPFTIIRKKYGE